MPGAAGTDENRAGGRIEGSVRELSEEIKEGFRVHGLGGFIQYFSETTVSFLNYFPKDHLAVFLDEPLRIKEKAEVVETEFRESMAHRLEGGYLLPGQTDFSILPRLCWL